MLSWRASGVLQVGLCALACSGPGEPAQPSAAPAGQLVSALPGRTGSGASREGIIADAAALREIIAHVPAPPPPTSASGTLVGSDTGIAGSEAPATETQEEAYARLHPPWGPSNGGSERDLRATLYWDLVTQCRDASGAELPPESVAVEFRVDPKGRIIRSTVQATAAAPAHEPAARCMARVLLTSEVRLTPPRIEKPIDVKARVPSVD